MLVITHHCSGDRQAQGSDLVSGHTYLSEYTTCSQARGWRPNAAADDDDDRGWFFLLVFGRQVSFVCSKDEHLLFRRIFIVEIYFTLLYYTRLDNLIFK